VLLGTFFAHENISGLQIFGLLVILVSVLLVNMAKYDKVAFVLSRFEKSVRNRQRVKPLSPVHGTEVCLNQP
jgi:hypothetical protein